MTFFRGHKRGFKKKPGTQSCCFDFYFHPQQLLLEQFAVELYVLQQEWIRHQALSVPWLRAVSADDRTDNGLQIKQQTGIGS